MFRRIATFRGVSPTCQEKKTTTGAMLGNKKLIKNPAAAHYVMFWDMLPCSGHFTFRECPHILGCVPNMSREKNNGATLGKKLIKKPAAAHYVMFQDMLPCSQKHHHALPLSWVCPHILIDCDYFYFFHTAYCSRHPGRSFLDFFQAHQTMVVHPHIEKTYQHCKK